MGGGYWVFEGFCFLDAFRGFRIFKDFRDSKVFKDFRDFKVFKDSKDPKDSKVFVMPKLQPAYFAKAWHTLSWKLRPTVDVETPLFMMANASMLPFDARR